MSVAVYPLLGELLRDRNMTIIDLEREIGRQYGITAGREALDRLPRGQTGTACQRRLAEANRRRAGPER